MNYLPSASGLDRAVACTASVVLPQVSTSSPAAERGTAMHTYLEKVARGDDPIVAVESAPEQYREWLRLIDVTKLFEDRSQNLDIEQAFALDVATSKVRFITKLSDRDYGPVSDTEFVGTLDLSYRAASGRLVVRDYKSGMNLGDPSSKMQLRFFALCYHLLLGKTEVDVEFVYVDEDGTITTERAETPLGVLEFQETLGALRELSGAVATSRSAYALGTFPTVKPGDHCRYCGAYQHCPAKPSLLKTALPDVEFVAGSLALMSPERIGAAYLKLQEIKNLTKHIDDVIRECVEQQDLPLGNGKRLTMASSSRSSFDSNRLIALARKLGADEGMIRSCMKKTTFDKLQQVKE